MKKIYLFPVVLILLVFSQCKKDKKPTNKIIAGYHDSSMKYEINGPIHSIDLQWDSSHTVQRGSDTLLLDNGSSVYALVFNVCRSDSSNNSKTTHFAVHSINSDKIRMRYKIRKYYAGLGTVASFSFVKPINKDAIINEDSMLSISNRELMFYEKLPMGGSGTLFNYDNGSWYSINGVRYVGILVNDKLGWIKIDLSSRYHPKIISYAIQK